MLETQRPAPKVQEPVRPVQKPVERVQPYQERHPTAYVAKSKDTVTITDKKEFTQDKESLSGKLFKKAKESYSKKDYASAIKEATSAQLLDLENKEIEEFIASVLTEALSK